MWDDKGACMVSEEQQVFGCCFGLHGKVLHRLLYWFVHVAVLQQVDYYEATASLCIALQKPAIAGRRT